MASYTITTTPVQEAALSAVVAEANAAIDVQNASIDVENTALAKQTPPGTPINRVPHQTNAGYLATRIADVLASYGSSHQTDIAQACVTAFMSVPTDKRNQILSLLGMSGFASLSNTDLANALVSIGLPRFMALSLEQQNAAFTLADMG